MIELLCKVARSCHWLQLQVSSEVEEAKKLLVQGKCGFLCSQRDLDSTLCRSG